MFETAMDNLKNQIKRIEENLRKEDLDYAIEARSIKVCKEFGLTAEETAKKLDLDLSAVKVVYEFDNKGLIDWSSDI